LEENDTLRRIYFKSINTVAFTDSLQNYSNKKPTNALILKLYIYAQFVTTTRCFGLSLSSSGSYWTSIKYI